MRCALAIAVSLFLVLTGPIANVNSQELATKEECIAKCEAAIALFEKVGAEAALAKLNQPDSAFRWKDSYVFAFDTNKAELLAHPSQRLLGWPMIEYRSADNVMVFKEILDHLKNTGNGWISYQYLINQQPPPVLKTAYYIKVPGEEIVVAAGYHEAVKSTQSQSTEPGDANSSVKIEEFVKSEGLFHGIAFDGKGHMFVGKNGKEILKVTPDGEISVFTVIEEADGYFIEGPGHTFLYDMEFDSQGTLYAAAEDRIIKISADGKITKMLEENFTGNWGACGIAVDQQKNVFYAYDNKIMKLTPSGKNELFFDGGKTSPPMVAIVGVDFGPDDKNLFACDGKLGAGKLVKIPVNSDGTAGRVELLYQDQKVNTEYIAFDRESNLIVKGPWSAPFIRVNTDGQIESLNHGKIGFGIQTIAQGGKGFDRDALYGTQMPSAVVYKINLP